MTIFGPASFQAGKETQRFGGVPVTPTRGTPQPSNKGQVAQTPRRPEREKKSSLSGWETDDKPEDGIVAFVRRQSIWESKRDTENPQKDKDGTRKQPDILSEEFYHPVTHQCPCIGDFVAFKKDSLHKRFHPKDRANKRNKGLFPVIPSSSNNQQISSYGVLTPTGFEQKDIAHYIEKDFDKREIQTYREKKHGDNSETGHKTAVVDVNEQLQKDNELPEPRGMTYLNIKKLLKFTSNDRKRLKIEDEEDEGYASKTSSAEAKEQGSDTERGDKKLSKSKMFSSMVNLSELPSKSEEVDKNQAASDNDARIKFSYTHQPTILQLPDPNIQVIPERIKFDRKYEKDEHSTYARIKRAKELNRYYNVDQRLPREESTVYNIDNLKPMTLVLRKISIQDADKTVTTNIVPHTWSSDVNYDRPFSTSPVRMSSRISQVGSGASRIGSGISRSSSSQSQTDPRFFGRNRPKSQYSRAKTYIDSFQDEKEGAFIMPDDLEFQANYPSIEKQATSYCIGDLLPAVEKSIFSTQNGKGRQVNDVGGRQDTAVTSTDNTTSNDGYVLLQKGVDLLSNGLGKSTLGPPPFRPNQTRHPLIRNVTVVVEKAKQMDSASGHRTATNAAKTGTFIQTPRIGSDKGIRTQLSPDKETKRKLKEAFTKFYQNRPKEIGKEFRRTQTMWQV